MVMKCFMARLLSCFGAQIGIKTESERKQVQIFVSIRQLFHEYHCVCVFPEAAIFCVVFHKYIISLCPVRWRICD